MFHLLAKALCAAVMTLTFVSQSSGSPLIVGTDLAARENVVARDAAVHVARIEAEDDDLIAPQEPQHLTPANEV